MRLRGRREPGETFWVLTQPRSGSTWFMQLLQRHPGIRTYGEVFLSTDRPRRAARPELEPPVRYGDFRRSSGTWRVRAAGRYLRLLRESAAEYDRVGCKLMYGHLLRNPELFASLVSGRIPVLHLIRHNTLDAVISGHIAHQSGRAHLRKGDVGHDVSCRVEVPKIVALIARRDRKTRTIRRLLRLLGVAACEISYEALVRDLDRELERAIAFLGLDPGRLADAPRTSEGLQKIVTGRREDVIENYAELRAALTGTAYECYL